MDQLGGSKEAWERLAAADAMWAVLTDPTKKKRRWDVESFFQTGTREISIVLAYLRSLGRMPPSAAVALDFGCGPGRVTQALAPHCATVHGIDISETMVREANRFNRFPDRCFYQVNDRPDLSLFPSATFDFVYSSLALQHVPLEFTEAYLKELVRVLKPAGTLVFQMPERFRDPARPSRIKTLQVKLRARTRLRDFWHRILGRRDVGFLMEMNPLPEDEVRRIISSAGGEIVDVRLTNSAEAQFNGDLRFLDHEPLHGWVSKQYCVTRPARTG